MIRARTIPAVVNPLCAVAFGADGETYVTAPIVTPGAYTIRDIIQTPSGTTCSVILNMAPATSLAGQTAKVRIDLGIQATTRGAHEADGSWVLAAGADSATYELLGTSYDTYTGNSPDLATAGSVFVAGRLHVGADVDASVELNWMYAWALQHGPAEIRYPRGGMGIINEALIWPGNAKKYGGGGKNTFFYVCDVQDQPGYTDYLAGDTSAIFYQPITSGVANTDPLGNIAELYCDGFTIYGNRVHQIYATGMHTVRLGDGLNSSQGVSVHWNDVHVFGSPGYGTQLGGHDFKYQGRFTNCTWQGSDSDNFDTKNRLNENDDMLWRDCRWGWHALGDQGTNLKPLITLTSNKFTTVGAGLSTVQVARSIDKNTLVGEVWTVKLAGMLDGINLNASPRITAVDSTHITLDYTPQVATAGGVTGGSAGATVFSPHISVGDCHVDCRGRRYRVLGAISDAEYFARTGFRQRGGSSSDPNGEGGTDLIFRDLTGVDQTAGWVVDTNAEGRGFVSVLGKGASISGIQFTSMATANGIAIGYPAERYRISDFQITGGAIGIQCRGNYGRFVNGVLRNQINKGIEVYGKTVTGGVDLPSNPFTPHALGSGRVDVYAPSHGTVSSAGFSNITQGANSLTIDPSNVTTYPLTTDDADHYHFTATGSNTDATLSAFGGDGVQAVYSSNTPNTAYNNVFIGVSTRQDDSNTAVGWSIGKSDGNPNGRAQGTRIMACEDYNSATPYEDAGSNTDWAGLNAAYDSSNTLIASGLPNNGVFDTVTASGLVSASYGLVGSGNTATGVYDFAVDGASSSIEFHGLSTQGEIAIAAFGLTHGDGSSRNWQVQVSQDNATWKNTNGDYARAGVSAGTNAIVFCGSVAAATPASGLVQIFLFKSALRHPVRINGGADNASTGAQSQGGYVTAAAALQAVRIVNSGGVNTTGGTVYCMGKV